MTDYIGGTSLDAEITVDLKRGEVLMDYSLNSFGSPFSSNDSTVISSEWRDAPFLKRLPYAAFSFLLLVAFIPLGILIPTFTAINQSKAIKPRPIWQLRYQKLLKWYHENALGTLEQSREGELKDPTLIFTIPNNIWIDYNLKGDSLLSINLGGSRKYGKEDGM